MKFKKKGAYAKAVAKRNGLFQVNGVLLTRGDFTQEEVDEFNGKPRVLGTKKVKKNKK